MAQIAIVMKVTQGPWTEGQIASWYEDSSPKQSKYGGPWGSSELSVHIALPEEMDKECVVAQETEGVWELVEDQALIDAKTQRVRDSKLATLRSQRDAKAEEADVEINKHADSDPNAIGAEADWKTYRVALRDITDDYKELDGSGKWTLDEFAEDMSDFSGWPVKPS